MLKKSNSLVTILLTGNRQIFKVAKSLLDDSKIEYFVKVDGLKEISRNDNIDELLNTSNGPIEIKVDNEKAVKARTLLADLQELDFDEKMK